MQYEHEYGGWRSSSKKASDALSWLQVTFVFPKLKEFMKCSDVEDVICAYDVHIW